MKSKQNGKIIVNVAAFAFLAGLLAFTVRFVFKAEDWAYYQTNSHVYTQGEMTKIGSISDRNGLVLSYTSDDNRIYNSNADIRKATIHAVGDSSGYISTGAQNALRNKLTGYSVINGFYTYNGNANNITLTIDSNVSVAAMKALGNYAGCVGMCNYKTGEIICMVSTPTLDIANENSVIAAQNGELGAVYINRFISSTYTPGSTFKIVTAAAALDTLGETAYTTEFFCDYGTVIGGEDLNCVGRHSTVSLQRAFSHSCNSYFSHLGLTIGRTKMTEYAETFGFNKDFYIDGIKAARSSYGVKKSNGIDFGWSCIGQYTDQMNPLQYLCAVSAVANGGEYIEPYFLKSAVSDTGYTVYTANQKRKKMLNADTAQKVSDLMDFAVSNNYGKGTFGNLDVCGKTGTAEIGEGIENSLFVGFCKDPDLPLAFVVVVEGGGSGRSSALNVANKTLQAAKKSLQN